MDAFGQAANWLEFGRPGEVSAAVEAAEFGELLWGGPGGLRARERQDGGVYQLSVLGEAGPLTVYEVVGIEGRWLR